MVLVVVRAVVRVANIIFLEVLYQSVYLVLRMEVVIILVRFYCCWWLCGAIGFDCGILVVVVMVMAVVRVELLIKSNYLTVCLMVFFVVMLVVVVALIVVAVVLPLPITTTTTTTITTITTITTSFITSFTTKQTLKHGTPLQVMVIVVALVGL